MDTGETLKVCSFDGQTVWYDQHTALFEVGNFLGGGAAGTVYECEYVKTHEHFALKILNPIGFKMMTPALIRKCAVVVKGKVVSDISSESEPVLTREDIWWLVNGSTKQFLGAYYSEKQNSLKELSLSQCIQIYGPEPAGVGEDDSGDADATVEIVQTPEGPRVYVPSIPPKYADFVRKRCRIFREIRNMRKISSHLNVIRLEGVLELTQETKCTIFLVMELANGGELFDRIKIDYGTREGTAKYFFMQLLEGVRHCHEQGVCHRDLKPENLLLQDSPEGTTLKIADFGFSARFAMENVSNNHDDRSAGLRPPHSVVHTSLTPSSPSMLAESPLRVLKSVVGSPFYVAPEVLQARGYDGPRADVWSLGVILYAMLAGNLPFGQELGTCKRFRHFCKWVREQVSKSARFWDDPYLEYPPWLFPAKFSVQAKGLIVSMLHPDPSCRITVLEAMAHPLCARDAPSMTSMPPTMPPAVPDSEKMATTNSTVVTIKDSDSGSNTAESHDTMRTRDDGNRSGADDDDDGGVFRMEEDGVSDNEDENVKTAEWSSGQHQLQQGSGSSPVTQVTQGTSSYGTAFSYGSPLSQHSSHGQLPAPPVAPTHLQSSNVHDLIILGEQEENDADSPTSARSARSTTAEPTATGAIPIVPPSFNDSVKRSTRFITAVPATEVLEKVERVLEECRHQKIYTPIGVIGKIEMQWQSFRLEVWGLDINGPPLCALQLYQMPADVAGTPTAPSHLLEIHADGGSLSGSSFARQLFLVEFIRGQLDIFVFKRFYQFVRQHVSELVKKDYAYKFLDSAASPMVDSQLLQRFQNSGLGPG